MPFGTFLVGFGAPRSYEELEEEGTDLEIQPGEKCLIDLWAIPKEEVLSPKGHVTPRWTEGAPFPATCRWGATGAPRPCLRARFGLRFRRCSMVFDGIKRF